MSETEQAGADRWDDVVEAAIMNLLGEVGKADLEGLLHVVQREKIRIDHDGLKRVLGRLSKEGRVRIDLDGTSQNPVVSLQRPFVGWT